MKRLVACTLLLTPVITLSASSIHATNTQHLTPYERIVAARAETAQIPAEIALEVANADANELIPEILGKTGLQYTFIRSAEERLVSLKTKAAPALALETIAFAAGFNIHKNGDYWVVHPLPLETTFTEEW